tara:strand:- start:264 stop:722 length:459 start_codon:yes stop_codon:yes gene_type:complete
MTGLTNLREKDWYKKMGSKGSFTGQLPASPEIPSYGMPLQGGLPSYQGPIWDPGTSGGGAGKGSGFGWNMDTMNMIGSGLGGLGNLARGWAAIKGLGIAEDQLEENKRQYNQNFGQQLRAFEGDRTRANTRISDQNAWKTAQGRTDLGSLIV